MWYQRDRHLIVWAFLCTAKQKKISCSYWPRARGSVHNDANDQGVQANSGGEDNHNEHADEGRTVLGSDESSAGTKDTDTKTTENIGQTNSDADPESSVTRVLSSLVCFSVLVDVTPEAAGSLTLWDEECHDEAIDSASFAKNDTDEVLGLDARHLHHWSEDRWWHDQDTPKHKKGATLPQVWETNC